MSGPAGVAHTEWTVQAGAHGRGSLVAPIPVAARLRAGRGTTEAAESTENTQNAENGANGVNGENGENGVRVREAEPRSPSNRSRGAGLRHPPGGHTVRKGASPPRERTAATRVRRRS